jgi:hypothetical protein
VRRRACRRSAFCWGLFVRAELICALRGAWGVWASVFWGCDPTVHSCVFSRSRSVALGPHEHVLPYYAVWAESRRLHFLVKYAGRGTLLADLARRGPLSDVEVGCLVRDIAKVRGRVARAPPPRGGVCAYVRVFVLHVRVFLPMFVCLCPCSCVCAHVRVFVPMFVCLCRCSCACAHVRVFLPMFVFFVWVWTCVRACFWNEL